MVGYGEPRFPYVWEEIKKLIKTKSTVKVDAITSTGTNIANINVDGKNIPIYAPDVPAGTGDKNYVHIQSVPTNTWVINHGLNKQPSITVVDSAGSVVVGDYHYNDLNTVTLTFHGAFSGKAFLN